MKVLIVLSLLCTSMLAQEPYPRPVAFDISLVNAQRVMDGKCITHSALTVVNGPVPAGHVAIVLDLNHLSDGRYLTSAIRHRLGANVLIFPIDAAEPIPAGFEHVSFIEADKNATNRRQRLITGTPPPAWFCD